MNKVELKKELKDLKKRNEAPAWMGTLSYSKLYSLLKKQNLTPKGRYKLIAKTAASYLPEDQMEWEDKFFNMLWKGWLAPSTPVMSNLGTDNGMAVSCSASYVGDSMWDISYTGHEVEMLSKYGFGTAAFLDVREGYSPISTGGITNPTKDWVEKFYKSQNWVSQGSQRRGSCAIYMDFWHGDLLEILAMLKTYDKLHMGIICDDSVKEALNKQDPEALKRMTTILTWRAKKGKPYIIFIDNARRQDPEYYKDLGLSSKQSNLCTEIFLHTDSDHTLSCVLSSLNLSLFDEWKDTDTVYNATVFLDCIAEDLIQRGSKIKGLERVVRSTVKGRALGLGALGYHTYLQQNMIPFDSFQARMKNTELFKHIHDESLRASKFLASWLGEPEWCKGTGLRNTHRTAIAPNTTSAFVVGAKSQGIEPFAANVFNQKLDHIGTVERINPVLLDLMKQKGIYTPELISKIALNKGSIQGLDEFNDLEKEVFKTAYEINQKAIIDYAEHRQKYICQGQSLNLFFSATEDEEWIKEVHKYAFEKDLLKSLYYVRMQAGIQADKGDECVACEG